MTRKKILFTTITAFLSFAPSLAFAQECDPEQQAKIIASDRHAGSVFGSNTVIEGNRVAVSSHGHTHGDFTGNASVYVFEFDGTAWIETAELLASDGFQGNRFGTSIAMSGDTIAVSAEFDTENGTLSGSVYIFNYDGTNWIQQAKLFPKDGDEFLYFGYSIALFEDTLVAASNRRTTGGKLDIGIAYIFEFDGTTWVEKQAIVPPTDRLRGFASSIAVQNNTIVVGSPAVHTDEVSNSGALFVYEYIGSFWQHTNSIYPTDPQSFSNFGTPVDLSGDVIVAGSERHSDGLNEQGTVYVYRRSGNGWTEEARLLASNGESNDHFGYSVGISHDTIVVGAPWADLPNGSANNSGMAYLFQRLDGQWNQVSLMRASDAGGNDLFSYGSGSISVDQNRAIIGSLFDRIGSQSNAGSAYIFDLGCPSCPADFTGDGSLNFFDVSAFLTAFNADDPAADFTGDGNYNFFDVSAFLAEFSEGCP